MNGPNPETFGPIRTGSEIVSIIQEISGRYAGRRILFRGQRKLHETIRSGRARPSVKVHKDVEAGWHSLATRMLNLTKGRNSHGYAKAILQHYGMATHFVDLTEDIEVAAWFATRKYISKVIFHAGSAMREYEHVLYNQSDQEHGFILVPAIPNAVELSQSGRLFDLSMLPSQCVRPHRQKGWLMLDRPPTEPTPNKFWVATIKIDCKTWQTGFKTTELFPGPSEDLAFATLLSLPFVQIPSAYFGSPENERKPEVNEEWRRSMEEMCLARRVLSIPEYGNESGDECTDHKWNDFTIYEPHHMRMWKGWRFELQSAHHGVTGDIKDTVKITLSPEAYSILLSSKSRVCSWPSLGADGLFFTFAALDHDKVSDHSPPYHGVWLQRDDELIVETPMEADENSLSVCAGHSYFLRDGVLERQVMDSACKCGKPETHDIRVRSVLQLSTLLEDGTLILLPHPRLAELGWYVVIAGSEGNSMIPQVASAKRIIKRLSIIAKPKPGQSSGSK